MSRLENYLKENRKKMDESEPPAGLWARIEKELDQQQKKKTPVIQLRSFISIAAMFIVVLATGLFFFNQSQKQRVDISAINPDLARQQVNYISLIADKRSELDQIKREEPELYKEFSSDINKVEKNYQQLKNSLPASPNPEETLKAMMINLQVQMDVLNQQLSVINQINESKKQENETKKL